MKIFSINHHKSSYKFFIKIYIGEFIANTYFHFISYIARLYFLWNWFTWDFIRFIHVMIISFQKCNTCWGYVKTILCVVSLACGLGNVYRLPHMVLAGGGLPFLVAYIIITVIVGLPLLVLEIGLGQIAQEGFMKTWRAVPLFRGNTFFKVFIPNGFKWTYIFICACDTCPSCRILGYDINIISSSILTLIHTSFTENKQIF